MANSGQGHSVFQFPNDSNLWGGEEVSKTNGKTQCSGHIQNETRVKCLTQFLLDSTQSEQQQRKYEP